jgi:hypothetical protein
MGALSVGSAVGPLRVNIIEIKVIYSNDVRG